MVAFSGFDDTCSSYVAASDMSPERGGMGRFLRHEDHTGAVTQRYSYDPFGKRRYVSGSDDEFGNVVIDWRTDLNAGTDRGYTGHEHLDDVGLIHMNGRIFDPRLGVFLQGDPFIQDPLNLQNYNRYAYCYNSPLICTDPSGQFIEWIAAAFVSLIVAREVPELRPFIAIAWSIALPGVGGPLSGLGVPAGISQAAVSGFISGTIASGGNLRAGLQGAFTAGVFSFAGDIINNTGLAKGWGGISSKFGQVALHGVVGCVTSEVGGGKCGAGALSAAFSKAALVYDLGGLNNKGELAGLLRSAVVGGTASALGGGKFSNGAVTAAFGYLFNAMAHDAKTSGGYDGTGGGGLRVSEETYRTWGRYLPGTEAGDSAAQYWADLHVKTGNPLYAVPGVLASLWTPDTAMSTAFTLGTGGLGGIKAIPEGIALGWKGSVGVWAHTYKHGGGGVNFFLGGSRVLAVDYHAFKLNGVVAPRLHYHRGLTPATQKLHRPYQGGW